jgi:Cys-tRNA(Pro)/Cys-tRNA(Cys) deacylase
LIPLSQLLKTTGYVRGGCSPLGMKKPFVTLFDKKVELLDKMIVSGGKIGLQIELNPLDLISVVSGQIADLIKLKQTV